MQYSRHSKTIGLLVLMLILGVFAIQGVFTIFAQTEQCSPEQQDCEDRVVPPPSQVLIVTDEPSTTTSVPSATATATVTASATLTSTATSTSTSTATATSTNTTTATATHTPTWTWTPSPTFTLTPSNTPPPTATPLVIQPVTACWVDDPSPGTSRWIIENPNPSPVRANPETKVRFDWFVFVDGQPEPIQSGTNYDNPTKLELQTRAGDRMVYAGTWMSKISHLCSWAKSLLTHESKTHANHLRLHKQQLPASHRARLQPIHR